VKNPVKTGEKGFSKSEKPVSKVFRKVKNDGFLEALKKC
jgi:hypothetical protein